MADSEDKKVEKKHDAEPEPVAAAKHDTLKHHVVNEAIPINRLEVKEPFGKLTKAERFYLHWISQASWQGSEICLEQTSVEAPLIFALFRHLFHDVDFKAWRAAGESKGVSSKEFDWFLHYAANFFANLGNYLSFGDTKFIPRIRKEQLEILIQQAPLKDTKTAEAVQKLFKASVDGMYSLDEGVLHLGFPINPEKGGKAGVSTYYTPNVTKEDMDLVGAWMVERKLSPYNTRLFKQGEGKFELRVAASTPRQGGDFEYKGATITLTYGDHNAHLAKVVACLTKAREYAANENQAQMMEAYVKHFSGGDIDDHKTAQKHWVRDVGPVVECNIGFIESYRDPHGSRGEWEGFVAMVNKEQSKKFGDLVKSAPVFLPTLPWSKEFEKEVFSKPDFTSLEVLTFASSGIPAGINIPNYDDIRQDFGFKNVSLGNVISSSASDEKLPFIRDEDQALFLKLRIPAYEVQVGCHELLGHGSGRVFVESADGKLNYSSDLINPFTKEKVTSHYKVGETYDQVFGVISSSFEECRAECVGIYLSANADLLKIFGHEDKKAQDALTFVNWLSMARAGVTALEFYNPEHKKWGQAHMQARWGILQVLLSAGDQLLKLHITDNDVLIELNGDAIKTVGVEKVGEFLHKLQVCKATADIKAAQKLYSEVTSVPASFLKLRDIVISKKKPRRIFVQALTKVVGDDVELQEFPTTFEGLIQAFTTQFPPPAL